MLYDSAAMRSFVGIYLGREQAPDETKVCKFRHLLEKHKLGEAVFKAVNRHFDEQGIRFKPWHDRGRLDHQCTVFDKE